MLPFLFFLSIYLIVGHFIAERIVKIVIQEFDKMPVTQADYDLQSEARFHFNMWGREKSLKIMYFGTMILWFPFLLYDCYEYLCKFVRKSTS